MIKKVYISFLLTLIITALAVGQNLLELPILSKKTVEQEVTFENCRNINSKKVEFSPAWYKDGIVYVAEGKGKSPFFQMYYSPIRDGMPSSRILFAIDKDTALHEGPMCFTGTQERMYFTRSNYYSGQENTDEEGKVRLQIFQADYKNGKWTNVEFLPFNDASYSVCHPSYDIKNKRLYFASDMPGGYGGMDIYYAELIGGNWSEPVNMGSAINSKADDAFPFYHEAGYLIFSSNRKGFGGYDFYLTTSRRHHALGALLLPPPFNSSADDLGMVLDVEARKGFISTNKKGGKGQDDLYIFQSTVSLLDSRVSNMITTIIRIEDEESDVILSDVDVFLIKKEVGSDIDPEWLHNTLFPKDGNVVQTGISWKGKSLNVTKMRTNAEGKVEFLAAKGSEYLIGLSKDGYLSRTDEIKMVQQNTLSISKDPCYALYFNSIAVDGSEKLESTIAIQDNCTGLRTDWSPDFCFKKDCDYNLYVTHDGYQKKSMFIRGEDIPDLSQGAIQILLQAVEKERPTITTKPKEEVISEPIEEGARIIIENLYYAYDDAGLRPQAQKELDKIWNLMQDYPSMKIELSSHTDCRGPDDFNMRLSRERALSATFYLLNKGIERDRIIAKGYGETQLRNHCRDGVECSEDEHALNRRTEILILNLDKKVKIIRR